MSKLRILCRAAFTASLGCAWAMGCRLDTPAREFFMRNSILHRGAKSFKLKLEKIHFIL